MKMNSLINALTQSFHQPQLLHNVFKRSIFLLTEFNCVDNSELGTVQERYRKPYLIGFYRKRRTADIGDIIKVAVKGKPCKALVVSTRKRKLDFTPRYDRNNIILLDENNNPLGTRVKCPVPTTIRQRKLQYPKVPGIVSRYI